MAVHDLRQILTDLGYHVVDRVDAWSECFVASDTERWRGKGLSADEALADVVAQMLPSALGRRLLERYEVAPSASAPATAAPVPGPSSTSSVTGPTPPLTLATLAPALAVRAVATAPLSGKTPPHQVAIAMPHRGLIAIADGGRATVAGGSAARMAAQTLVQVFESTATLTPLRMRGLPALLGAIQRANREMQEATKRDPKLKTMQASLAAVLSAGGHVAIARVGTASVYRVRGGEIERMVEAAGDAAQGKASERLGAEKTVEVETSIQPAEPGDLYLVCTSGGRSVAGTDLADFVTPGKPGEAEPDLEAALGSLSRARQDLSPWAGAVLQLASTPGACA